MPLNSQQRRALRAQAHGLKPVAQTGANGVTESFLAEAEIAIEHHELIKLRLSGADRDQRREMSTQLVDGLQAEQIGLIGNVLILYRPSRKGSKKKSP